MGMALLFQITQKYSMIFLFNLIIDQLSDIYQISYDVCV